MTEIKLKPCPRCQSERLWTIRLLPKRWIFTKYFVECRVCHWCGQTKMGKRNAIKAWNRRY